MTLAVLDTVRTAIRSSRAALGFVGLAAATIALGVGLTTGIFSVVNAVLLRPLPYAEPDRLVAVGRVRGAATDPTGASEPELLDWRERTTVFDALEFTSRTEFVLRTDAAAEWITGATASRGFFDTLGVRPLLGRTFAPGEDQPGRHQVALISERIWRTRFGADPAVVGRQVHISASGAEEAQAFAVIGVLPRDVPINYDAPYDILIPHVASGLPRASGARRRADLQVIGRLSAGVPVERAAAEMRELAGQLTREYPMSVQDASVAVKPLHELTFGGTRTVSFTLLGPVAAVLIIATVNLGSLLLTRSVRRRHEMAVRVAIGASRRRLVGEIAAEGVILAALGGTAGLLVSLLIGRIFLSLAPATLLRADQVRLDIPVLLFSMAITTFCALSASIIPALRATRANAGDALRRQPKSGSRLRRGTMIAAQAALVTIVLAGAGLLVSSVWHLTRLPLGFTPQDVVTMHMIVPSDWMQDNVRRSGFERDLRARIGALPGVTLTSASADVPMSAGSRMGVVPEGATAPHMTTVNAADADYLPLLQVPLITGRGIADTDTAAAPRVALVNRAFVRAHWPDGEALGRGITLLETHEVVGIVDDVVELTDGRTRMRRGLVPSAAPAVYVPLQQFRMGRITYLSARASVAPSPAVLAAVVNEVAPEVTIRRITTLDELVRAAMIETRFYAAVLMLFGGIALVLAAVGVYGVVAQSVSERIREFGVRIALGATPRALQRTVLTQTGLALALGAAFGLLGAAQVTWTLSAWLFGVRPTDPWTLLPVSMGLIATGLLSAWRPARAASLADPIKALRAD